MNLTLFIGSLYNGGAERVTCNLASFLAERGHTVEILTMSETERTYELSSRVSVTHLLRLSERKNALYNNILRIPRLTHYLRSHRQTDAYVVMLPETITLLLAMKPLTRARMILSERADPSRYNARRKFLLKHLAPRADGFVFQTEDARAWYRDIVRGKETAVIPNAINPLFLRPAFTGTRQKTIVSAGRLNRQKHFSLLISAFSQIAQQFPDWSLTIFGEGYTRPELEEQIAQSGLQDRVSLPGNVTDIADRLQSAGMFVLASDFEGMPNALMEAMALGLPCISTDCPVGGPRYLIRSGENGLLIPVNDVQALANAMQTLLEHQELAAQLGAQARNIQETLAPEQVYSRWEAYIQACVSR